MSIIQSEQQTVNFHYVLKLCHQLQAYLQQTELKDMPVVMALADPGIESQNDAPEMQFERLCRIFRLSSFERNILLMGIAFEVIPNFAEVCAKRLNINITTYPTIEILPALFPDADWSAWYHTSPLRYWQLITLKGDGPIGKRQIKVSEDVLQYATGDQGLSSFLASYLQPLKAVISATFPSHQAIAEQLFTHWSMYRSNQCLCPHLSGNDETSKENVVTLLSTQWSSKIYRVDLQALPKQAIEWDQLHRLFLREAHLHNCIYWVEYSPETLDESGKRNIKQFAQTLPLYCILSSEDLPPAWLSPYVQNWAVDLLQPQEQFALWQTKLITDKQPSQSCLEQLVNQFSFNDQQINRIAASYNIDTINMPDDELSTHLWQCCRQHIRQSVAGLVKVIEPKANWNDLVLSEPQRQILHAMVAQVKHRHQVYQTWGIADKSNRGLGISALFVGPSGTGKTLAAEVMAHELQLDVYHIDLSAIVSKWVGETEKHLKKIFDLAETSGAILLFDEADAVFGKRSEVKDSHDRFANLQVSYLLQRMEAYRGLSILTSNLKNAIDDAFLRRIRFIVQFPFPNHAQRVEIWQRIFPKQLPTQGLVMEKLARLNLAGGHIKNIAVNAAFLAAEEQSPVTMTHLLRAAQSECLKLEKPLIEAEVKNWV